MTIVKLKLPVNISVHELQVDISDVSDLPLALKKQDVNAYEVLYMENNGQAKLKAFASVFLNNRLLFDEGHEIQSDDVVEISMAIAGG